MQFSLHALLHLMFDPHIILIFSVDILYKLNITHPDYSDILLYQNYTIHSVMLATLVGRPRLRYHLQHIHRYSYLESHVLTSL